MKKMKKAGFLVGLSILLIQTTKAQTLKEALKYTENHQFELASTMFHKLIAEKPTDAHLYYYMGENMYKSERFDSAAFYYDKGISIDPNIGLNYVGKGKIALSKNDESTAKPLFEKALFHHTHDAKAYIAIAEAYVENEWKNMTYVVECLEKAEKMDRSNVNIYLLIGDAALLGSNDGITALNNYEKARDMEPKNPKPLIQIGTLYERARSYDLAFAEYNKAVSLDTTFAPSYYKLGDLYYQYGDYKSAFLNLDKYVKLSGSLSARIKRAKYRFLAKEYEGAIFDIEDIMTLDNSINILHRLLAYSYFETKKYPEALLNMEKFLKNVPTSGDKVISDDYRYYGKILLAVSKDSTAASLAIPQLKTAIEKDSTKLDVYSSLADAYLKTKHYDAAISILQKKISLVKEPTTNDIFKIGQAFYVKAAALNVAFNNKKKSKDTLGLFQDSIAYYNTFLQADSCFTIVTAKQPELVSAYVFRGKANAGMDPETKKGLAKPHYETVIALGTLDIEKNKKNLIEAHYYLGYYYYLQKDKAKALENINKVLEYDPNNTNAPNLKKFIEKLP